MIKNIVETIEGELLTVNVSCKERKFCSIPINLLTTEEVIDKINNKYKILTTISMPKYKVGNSVTRGIKTHGTWKFKIETEKPATQKKEEKIEKPKTKTTRTPKNPPTNEPKQAAQKTSIRNRISKLANKED